MQKTLEKQNLNFSRSVLFYIKSRVSLRYFMNDCRFPTSNRNFSIIIFFFFLLILKCLLRARNKWWQNFFAGSFKDVLSGLKQFLATKRPLKIIKNVFYFTLNDLFVLNIFKFLFRHFGHVEKRLHYKDKGPSIKYIRRNEVKRGVGLTKSVPLLFAWCYSFIKMRTRGKGVKYLACLIIRTL